MKTYKKLYEDLLQETHMLGRAVERAIQYIEPRVKGTGGYGETVVLPSLKSPYNTYMWHCHLRERNENRQEA